MTDNQIKPTILWVLQDNQVSPIIVDFLNLLRKGIGKINVQVVVPMQDTKITQLVKPLDPKTFQATRTVFPTAVENFHKKKEQLASLEFTSGLEIWKALVMDDLGAGVKAEAKLHLPHLPDVVGIVLQIPTPLGSASPEEVIFYEWIKLAHDNNIFIAGYELLPLYTRWTLLPAMLDGIITTSELAFDYLTNQNLNIKGKVWKLPRNEGKVFSPGVNSLWHNGLESPYLNRQKYNIPKDKTILYIAHNVATSYEYRRLLEEISLFGKDIHLMFSYGKDQIRGTHSHKEVISTISHDTLDLFYSHSFHDLSQPWEMTIADAALAVSHCYSIMVAENSGIPCIIMDPMVPEATAGNLAIVNSHEQVKTHVAKLIENHQKLTDITEIIYQIATGKVSKIHYQTGKVK
ncbi:MAG: hypothetical protein ABIJ31_01680 [Pseudomonadota bacterium]